MLMHADADAFDANAGAGAFYADADAFYADADADTDADDVILNSNTRSYTRQSVPSTVTRLHTI